MKMDELISVIIPCYNLAGLTRRCFDSILAQTYKNIEIIAVDDGSTDNTRDILMDYASKDKRLHVFRQENRGAGNAINFGVSVATGSWIGFVDNDDWIEPDMYEKLYKAAIENKADVSVCNFDIEYEDHSEKLYSTMTTKTVNISDNPYEYFAVNCACPKPNNYVWARLYRADILKKSGIVMEEFRLGADTLYNFKHMPMADRVTYINMGLYHYWQRPGSSVHVATSKGNIAEVYADVFDSLADYFLEKGYNEFLSILPTYAFTRLRSIYFYSRLAGMTDEEILENVEKAFRGRKIYKYLTGAK